MSALPRAILIAGPTASGKSSAALNLAREIGGAIVNADSMQVYSELQILSARPGGGDEALAPHYLYGTVPAAQAFSVGMWIDEITKVLCQLEDKRQVPIIVGGTGLYFQALEQGLSPIPDIPTNIRLKWRDRLALEGAEVLHGELREKDEASAEKLKPGDSQRIVRALEVLEATGKSLQEWHAIEPSTALLSGDDILKFVVAPERAEIYRRCDLRFNAMVEEGGLDEVRALLALELDGQLPAMKALGVPQLAQYLRGEVELVAAVERAKTDTRRYAKRQLTWLRRNMIAWNHLNEQQSERILGKILSFI